MVDERIKTLAYNLVNYSCDVQPGENVYIELTDVDLAVGRELIKAVKESGARPYVRINDSRISRELLKAADEEQLSMIAETEGLLMSHMQAYIGIRGVSNSQEYSDVDEELLAKQRKLYWQPVHGEIRVPKTKWVVLRWPTAAFAQSAEMSTEAFEDFYFNVCNLDYSKMSKAMDKLVDLMNKTDKVRIVAEDTDLSFSIKDIPAVKCDGKMNIPDGEVYTAPIKNSVNGYIHYNTPSLESGFLYKDVRLTFKDGKIIEVDANDRERCEKVFNTDEGARYVGEFAIGVNPFIKKPMYDILFDEKISGSIHFTPGCCYDDAPNGNKSAVHWDLVLIQSEECGGGEIYFDDVLIRKNGRFVVEDLLVLNPENLI